ncbi:MAG: phospholipase D family protein [Fibrobacterota bacterium]
MKFIRDREHYSDFFERYVLKAEKYIWISSANVKDMHIISGKRSVSFLRKFSEMAESGVCIRLIHAGALSSPFKESFDLEPSLFKGGMEMQECIRVHSKLVIVDGVLGYCGSANITGAGMGAKSRKNRNFETGFITENALETRPLADYFDRLWMGEECRDCGRKKMCPDPII